MSYRYGEHDRSRWMPEPAKRATLPGAGPERRSPFERDRARVLHSAALRRLAGKTQVVGPSEGDVPRTRLTHSLEVAQIGGSIAAELGADRDVVETAGLAHDIGHPPFGHNGEQALDDVAESCGGFEANAQTLRILTRLEPKVIDTPTERSGGLNLTRAVLDTTVKYPWPRQADTAKFGYFAPDAAAFHWIRDGAPPRIRSIEAQVMDWADDVAYSVHDVEDGILAGRIRPEALADPVERAVLAELAGEHFTTLGRAELETAAAGLLEIPVLGELRRYDRSLGAQVALKELTSELVGRFAHAVVSATVGRHGPDPLGRYRADLVVPARVAAEVALLKAMALRFVMSDPQRLAAQARQRDLVAELCAALLERAPTALDPPLHPAWLAAENDGERLRVVVDQVATLTDGQAVRWHAQLTGPRQGPAPDLRSPAPC